MDEKTDFFRISPDFFQKSHGRERKISLFFEKFAPGLVLSVAALMS
jgi:hypothetical protein